MIIQLLLPLVSAAALSVLACRLMTPMAIRIGLVDHPSARKVHRSDVPLVGGIGVFFSFAIVLTFTGYGCGQPSWLLVACGLLLIVGAIDDWRHITPPVRFLAQIAACCVMIFHCDVLLTDLGFLMWDGLFALGWFAIPVTIFSALGVINAFNMMDGIDGLSSMVFFVSASAMAALAVVAGQDANAGLLLIAIAAVAGFFLLNARVSWNRRFRVFLGDSGSGFLGFLLAWQFIDLGNGADRAFAPMTAVWIFGVPLADTLCVMGRRWFHGKSMVEADKTHLHHAFLRTGFGAGQTWLIMTALMLASTAIGLAGHFLGWAEYVMFYVYITLASLYCHTMNRCWSKGRFLGRQIGE